MATIAELETINFYDQIAALMLDEDIKREALNVAFTMDQAA